MCGRANSPCCGTNEGRGLLHEYMYVLIFGTRAIGRRMDRYPYPGGSTHGNQSPTPKEPERSDR